MANLLWQFVYITTIILYVLILISLPFNQIYATVMLFTLLGYWSKLPGTGIPAPGFILYAADLVDFFSVIISLGVSPWVGAFYSAFCNLSSRAVGITPRWIGVMKDTIAQFICCLITPLIYHATGESIFTTMMYYTFIRMALFFPLRYIDPEPHPLPVFLVRIISFNTSTVIVNMFYAYYLGDFFDAYLKQGMHFSWPLFFFATIVIAIAFVYLKNITLHEIKGFLQKTRTVIFSIKSFKQKEEHRRKEDEYRKYREIQELKRAILDNWKE